MVTKIFLRLHVQSKKCVQFWQNWTLRLENNRSTNLSDFKQTSFNTISRNYYHALSHGLIYFVQRVGFENSIDWNIWLAFGDYPPSRKGFLEPTFRTTEYNYVKRQYCAERMVSEVKYIFVWSQFAFEKMWHTASLQNFTGFVPTRKCCLVHLKFCIVCW